jgi:hypothetical protein
VSLKPTVLGLLKRKGKGVKEFVRSKPDKTALAHINIGDISGLKTSSDFAVQAVARHHQVWLVVLEQCIKVVNLGLINQLNAQLGATILQNTQQVLSPDPTKAVSCRAHTFAFEKKLNIIPMVKRIADLQARHLIGLHQVLQGLVTQDDTPPEGVMGTIALKDCDAQLG